MFLCSMLCVRPGALSLVKTHHMFAISASVDGEWQELHGNMTDGMTFLKHDFFGLGDYKHSLL